MSPPRVVAAGLLALVPVLAGCSDRAVVNASQAPAAVPVTVGESLRKTVPIQVSAVGNVQALTTVGVKSQINGQVVAVHFKDGQELKRGDLLFTIDARPFEAALRQAQATVARDTAQLGQAEAALGQREAEVQQAQANLERDLAQLENARTQERRYRGLVEKELIAREQYDQIRTNLTALEATVQAGRAAIENAKASLVAARAAVENARAVIRANEAAVDSARLQLGYTTIRSPLDGRTGSALVQAGNIVKANDESPMVVINQVRPISLTFAVPEQYLDDVRHDVRRARAGRPLRVEARLPNQSQVIATGELTFVNNTVDPQTGTVQLKATFANADNALWPGQFLEAVLTLSERTAVVVPSPAIQPGQRGPYVFVVKPDLTVEARPVQPGLRLGAETIVDRGLEPGERVVTDGHLRLVPGAKVEIKPAQSS
jgi:multidrug efflux system membrane fusion protein